MGALLISDSAFHRQICQILFQNRGKPIRDIAEIAISHML
jgi:hypothetical protein